MLTFDSPYITLFLKIGGKKMGAALDTIQSLTVITLFLGLFSAIFWMVVGWRAMRAHEKLADSMEWLARQYYRKEWNSDSSQEN